MTDRRCRACGGLFFPEPVLLYEKMPRAAQGFPDGDSVKEDEGSDLVVAQCSGCGLVQLDGEPVPYYREVIRAAAVSDVLKKQKREQFARLVGKFSLRGKKVIEIGCGRGEFLSLLDPREVHAFGLEYSAASVGECERKGLNVARGFAGEGALPMPGAPYDAFLLLMFLEHLPDPNASLRAICNSLKEGGIGLVEVPNFEMVLRKKLFSEFIADHLFYFTRATLQGLLERNGFEVVELHTLRDGYVISAVVRKRARIDVTEFRGAQSSIQAQLDAFLSRFPRGRVAIWGAGHQSLAVIALTGIKDRIRFVVDSAPFKQDKFTPATHLPIVSPWHLSPELVDAVIVIAGSYSDEVAGIVQQRFGKRMATAVLSESGLEERFSG